jgi:hypothetical protein
VLLTVITAAAVVFIVVWNIGPSYQATIEQITPTGSSRVIVEFQVKNLGGSPATPTCQIDMSSSAAAFTGTRTFTANRPIPGSSVASYSVLIPVTTDGAARVNFKSSNVSCQ